MTRPDKPPLPFACKDIRAHWQHLLDDEPALAAQADRTALSSHCAACADCAEWTAAAQQLREGLAARRSPSPSPGLTERLLTAVQRDRRRRRLRRYAGVALAACLLLATAAVLVSGVGRSRSVAVREGAARQLAARPTESVDDHLSRAGAALVSLTRRTADEVEPTVSLLSLPPAPRLAASVAWPPALGPAAQPLTDVRQGTAKSFEPVASTTLRALDLFRRQLPRDPDGRPGL